MRPFSCGSQYVDWTEANCSLCRDCDTCPHLEALARASFGDGEIPDEDALAIGADRWGLRGFYQWPCPAFRHADGGGWDINEWEVRR